MAPSKNFAFSAVALIASFALQASAITYTGCVNDVSEFTIVGGVGGLDFDECTSYCSEGGAPYLAYQTSGSQCLCTSESQTAEKYTTGASQQGGCADPSNYVTYALQTTFNFQGCYSNMVTDNAPDNFNNFEQCFAACANEGSVMFNPYSNAPTFGCRCNNAYAIDGAGNEVTCGTYTWYTFTHSMEATASGLARRMMKERLMQLKRESQTLCPQGSKACTVPGSASYECIDTRSELESCGGCLHGEYQATSNVTLGTDCSTLPGVALGAITCSDSQCEAFACKTGYELVSGLCVPIA
ncbi:hypothetical protein I302_101532 [Kwoniella bestiolae CBS 10118]|uniref:Protein CPL1-like domain-containing protein n=1 Tax=Kwoniella bestiolae CBS 10118 TaxID=1296100 RepID=A0A1B9GCI2_9TREE|nr:hypothetical protein I302_00216 [Kwoniella bestiolae CBS 10118]OCF28727.1 hypothetical protein I302_00216 [Kwoniella bestiolae CBS 10118]